MMLLLSPSLFGFKPCNPTPNRLFWYCKLLEKPIRKIKVSIPSTHLGVMRPQLVFKAQEIEKNNEKFYRHEIIYKREFQREQRIKESSQLGTQVPLWTGRYFIGVSTAHTMRYPWMIFWT